MRGTCVGWFINVVSSVPTVRWLVCWVAQSAHKHNDPSVHHCLQLRGKRRTSSILSWTLHTTTASHGSFCPCWESTSCFFHPRNVTICCARSGLSSWSSTPKILWRYAFLGAAWALDGAANVCRSGPALDCAVLSRPAFSGLGSAHVPVLVLSL